MCKRQEEILARPEATHEEIEKLRRCLAPVISYVDSVYRREEAGSFGKPEFYSAEQTMREVLESGKSLERYGDGEFTLMVGEDECFQVRNSELAQRLEDIITSKPENLLIAYPPDIFWRQHQRLTYEWNWMMLTPLLREKSVSLMPEGEKLWDANISNVMRHPRLIPMWREFWEKQDIAVICGERVFAKLEYNVFDNASSVEYLYVPTCNAYEEYASIQEAARQIDKSKKVFIMAGPTATVLAYDLTLAGYRAFDVGHLAKSYDVVMRDLPRDHEVVRTFFACD